MRGKIYMINIFRRSSKMNNVEDVMIEEPQPLKKTVQVHEN